MNINQIHEGNVLTSRNRALNPEYPGKVNMMDFMGLITDRNRLGYFTTDNEEYQDAFRDFFPDIKMSL